MVEYLEQAYEMKIAPLPWRVAQLQQTASGYGAKLTSTRKIRIVGESRWRRVYITCYSNAGSAWVVVNGKRLFLRD